jgi:hypothetical protein
MLTIAEIVWAKAKGLCPNKKAPPILPEGERNARDCAIDYVDILKSL